MLKYPLDAVARGAAAFIGGVDLYDHIQHDYAIRFYDSERRVHEFKVIVPRGTAYPTAGPIQRYVVKATNQGQKFLGINIFEMGQKVKETNLSEIVFDGSGAARVIQVTAEELEQRRLFWLNEKSPTFLEADPPADRGEARFDVEFSVDGNKRLLLSARDMRNNRITHQNYPVVRLS
jgi:hypothetical protein